MKKILITGANGMLATDFISLYDDKFELVKTDRNNLDITKIDQIIQIFEKEKPDLVLNLAAYTQVDDAEDIGKKINFDVNALGVYNLAKITHKLRIDFITISTDYVFDGKNEFGYNENDICNPINSYGMAKYLGEKLAKSENKNSIIIRTSWLYGGGKEFKNFVNTMLKLGQTKKELKVVNDQFGSPTNAKDLSNAIFEVIENIANYRGKILHFSNETEGNGITWFDFATEIFKISGINVKLIPCTSDEFPTKAIRPKFSKLKNNSDVKLREWKMGVREYIKEL